VTPAARVYTGTQLVFLACGIAFAVFFFGALYSFMKFIPPPSPLLGGAELVARYSAHPFALKIGIIIGMLSAGLLLPWSGLVAIQIARMEKERRFPLLSLTSLAAGSANAVFFMLPFVFWGGAFYRADNPPELIRLVNDMTWLEFVMLIPPFCTQTLCLGFAVLAQRDGVAVFPRWFGYLSIWVALLVVPGILGILFYSGPFAWNGLIVFWLPVSAFSIYLTVTYALFYRAIMSHARDAALADIPSHSLAGLT
jgi:hypothetical protein